MDRSRYRLGPDHLPVPFWQRAWLDAYPSDVPSSLSYPNVPVSALLESAAHQFPDRTACTMYGRSLSYNQLAEQGRRRAAEHQRLHLAGGCAQCRLRRQQRVPGGVQPR